MTTTWPAPPRRLPRGWSSIRMAVLNRDAVNGLPRCTELVGITGRRCDGHSLEVDHVGHRDDHNLDNLRTLCRLHHSAYTALRRELDRDGVPYA